MRLVDILGNFIINIIIDAVVMSITDKMIYSHSFFQIRSTDLVPSVPVPFWFPLGMGWACGPETVRKAPSCPPRQGHREFTHGARECEGGSGLSSTERSHRCLRIKFSPGPGAQVGASSRTPKGFGFGPQLRCSVRGN